MNIIVAFIVTMLINILSLLIVMYDVILLLQHKFRKTFLKKI